jgi:hypothetical protein
MGVKNTWSFSLCQRFIVRLYHADISEIRALTESEELGEKRL